MNIVQEKYAIQKLMKECIYDDRTKTTYKVRITKHDNRTKNSKGVEYAQAKEFDKWTIKDMKEAP